MYEYTQSKRKFINRDNFLYLIALIVAVLAWALVPDWWVKLFCLVVCWAVLLLLAYRSHWASKWKPWIRAIAAFVITLALIVLSAPQLINQWRQAHLKIDDPEVTIATQGGLTPTDFPDLTISTKMSHELRRQNLVIKNTNKIDILNLVMRFQLPEPVIGSSVIENRPAGVELTWNPCRLPYSVIGSVKSIGNGGITISSDAKPGAFAGMFVIANGNEVCSAEKSNKNLYPTGIYQLKIERLPAGELIHLSFITSIGEGTDHYREKVEKLKDSSILFFGEGTYQYTSNNQTETRQIFVELTFNERTRRVSSLQSSGDYGERSITKFATI